MINEIKPGKTSIGYYLAENPEVRTTSGGKQFLSVALKDKTGTIEAKKWDLRPSEIEKYESLKSGTIMQAEVTGEMFKNKIQGRIGKLRIASHNDEGLYDLNDLILSAPEEPEKMLEEILNEVRNMTDPDYKRVLIEEIEKYKTVLLTIPAAKKVHHAYRGGLLHHTVRMMRAAKRIGEVYEVDMDLLLTGTIFHDFMKMKEMETNEYGIVEEYTTEGSLLGHVVMGVSYIGSLDLPQEKKLILQHIILSHHGHPEFGSPVCPAVPEAVIIHHIDMMDAEIAIMEKEMEKTEPGTMSDRVWALDQRKIYHRNV